MDPNNQNPAGPTDGQDSPQMPTSDPNAGQGLPSTDQTTVPEADQELPPPPPVVQEPPAQDPDAGDRQPAV